MNLSRRRLLSGLSSGALMAAAGPGLNVGFAAAPGVDDILVVIYLRGGSDGLQMIAPAADADYIAARPVIRVPATGEGAGTAIGTLGGVDFFLNSDATALKPLYDSGRLAIVHATGIPDGDRSHFEAQDAMEQGEAPGEASQTDGWLTRHLLSLETPAPLLSTVSSSGNLPLSLLGYTQALAIPNVDTFSVLGGSSNASLLRKLMKGASPYKTVGNNTLDAIDTVQGGLPSVYTSAAAQYTTGPLSTSLKSLAKLIKMNVGVNLATVDHNGWDHHDNLLAEFSGQALELSQSLKAFWDDLVDYQDRLTIVTMTEFGRRVAENDSAGTDHGAASYMFIIGGHANGGKIYGEWPGLKAADLSHGDLMVTTDYRQVLAEILVKRHGQTDIGTVFPVIPYQPLGLVNA